MGIRAKFKCESVANNPDGSESVSLCAVVSAGDDENKSWSKYTPAGQLTMTISNPAAQGAFEPGKAYFLDVAPADT